jgi:hypothetical protein
MTGKRIAADRGGTRERELDLTGEHMGRNMRNTFLITLLLLSGTGSYFLSLRATPAAAQGMARCKVSVPQSWGEYIGASDSFGLAFKDSSGTLRFVRQLPCGLDSTPSISVEVQRN